MNHILAALQQISAQSGKTMLQIAVLQYYFRNQYLFRDYNPN